MNEAAPIIDVTGLTKSFGGRTVVDNFDLRVPRGAVRSDGNKRFVFVLDGQNLRRRDVSVGIASATRYEILDGLREGERVAFRSDAELRDGMAVRPAAEK